MSFNNTYFSNSNDRNIRMANAGPSTPVGVYDGKILPNFGATRVKKVRPKEGYTMQDVFGPPVDRASTDENFDTFRKIAQVDTKIAQGERSKSLDSYLNESYGFDTKDRKWRNMPGYVREVIKDSHIMDTEKNKQSNLTDRVTDFISKIFTPPAVAGTLDENREFGSDFSGELTSNIFNRAIPNVDDMVRNIGAAFDAGGMGGLSVSEPSQRRTVRIGGINFPQSRFGKPAPRVQSPMEAGMGPGAAKARDLAKARKKKSTSSGTGFSGSTSSSSGSSGGRRSTGRGGRRGGSTGGSGPSSRGGTSSRSSSSRRGSTGRGGRRGGSTGGSGASSRGGTSSRSGRRTGRGGRRGGSKSRCDLRCKVDISLLTSMNLMRDDLAEVAYFVKELQEIK